MYKMELDTELTNFTMPDNTKCDLDVSNDDKFKVADSQSYCLEESTSFGVSTSQSQLWPRFPSQPGNYKTATVLTNIERGNIPTVVDRSDADLSLSLSLHQRAGFGEIRPSDLYNTPFDVPDSKGHTPLLWASAYGQTPTVLMLLRAGANRDHCGAEGETAIHLAACGGHTDTIRALVEHNLVKNNAAVSLESSTAMLINVIDENSCTPLMFAAIKDYPCVIMSLLMYGADFTLTNINGDTAYSLAVKHKSKQALNVLENHILSLIRKAFSST